MFGIIYMGTALVSLVASILWVLVLRRRYRLVHDQTKHLIMDTVGICLAWPVFFPAILYRAMWAGLEDEARRYREYNANIWYTDGKIKNLNKALATRRGS